MSGLVCAYHANGIDENLERYLGALRRLAHRGQDGEVSELRRNLFLGVRYNSVTRGSAGERPAVSQDGKVFVGLDGHIHNREDLEHGLRARGYRADLTSDPALVLGAYLEYGERCFERLHGVWALLLWDEREQELLLSRDRIGVRPLYYYISPRHLLAASEIKSIIALDPDARAIDHGRVGDLIHRGRIDDWTGTCFAHIRPVAPGTVLRFDGTQFTSRRYWTLRPATDRNAKPGDILERLVGAVQRHTAADIRIGLALSGGIDSSCLAGILAHSALRGARNVHAYSINPPKMTDESFLIDATIRRTGIPHSYVPLHTLDYARTLTQLIDAHDEPIQFSGVLYQFALRQRMAEEGCKAVLVGYGADEIFGGYRYLTQPFLIALAANGRLRDCVRFVLGAGEFVESSRRHIVYQALREALGNARGLLLRPLEHTRVHAAYRSRRTSSGPSSDVLLPWKGEKESDSLPGPAEFETRDLDRGRIFFNALLQCFRTNIPLLVRLEDRNAMAHGLDLCAPFLDDQLIGAALAFPFHRYMKGGWNKAVLREAVKELLAPEVRGYRRKLATPGNDAHLIFELLRPEFLDLLSSESFYDGGLWSRRSRELYQDDALQQKRATMWFRVYLVHKWHEQVVRSRGS